MADTGEWVEGDLIHGVGRKKGKMYILPVVKNLAYLDGCDPLDGYEITPETKGQFTGRTNDDGIKIFEDDMFKDDDNKGGYFRVQYDDELSAFVINLYGYETHTNEGGGEENGNEIVLVDRNVLNVCDMEDEAIIGNIHDYKKLING